MKNILIAVGVLLVVVGSFVFYQGASADLNSGLDRPTENASEVLAGGAKEELVTRAPDRERLALESAAPVVEARKLVDTVSSKEPFDSPVIRGRVVAADGAGLLGNQKIYDTFEFHEDGRTSRMYRGGFRSTREQGLFVIHCPERVNQTTVLVISVSGSNGAAKKEYELKVGEMEQHPWGWQAGDLRLSGFRTLEVRVQDVGGKPIEGAVAFTAKEQRLESEKSDEFGRCQLKGVEDAVQSIGAVAVGFRVVHVPIAKEGPTTVTLEGGNQLEVQVLDVRGLADERLQLHMVSEVPMFYGDEVWPAMAFKRLDASGLGGAIHYDGGTDVTFTHIPSDVSRFRVFDITPELPFRLEVQDSFGHVLVGSDVDGLAPREHRVERYQVQGEVFNLRGRVLDPLGEVVQCRVAMMGSVQAFHVKTDEEGRFSFDGLGTEDIWLRIDTKLYARFDYRGRVPKGGDLGDLFLEQGNTLMVRVVDRNGGELKAHVMTQSKGMRVGDRQHSKLLENGLNELSNLASGEVGLLVSVGGVNYERTVHMPRAEILELEFPVHGGVEVTGLDVLRKNRKVGWRVYLAPIDEDKVVIVEGLRKGANDAYLRPILPGRYHLRLQEWQPRPIASYKDLIEPRLVEVVAGQVTRVDL